MSTCQLNHISYVKVNALYSIKSLYSLFLLNLVLIFLI